ncbi:putative protein kinase ArgK-like GTPase of G3E family [Paenibacillus phyllosphaerae]|uniref:Uncharacterized protein n=1 Tax=Paenibacillus phyllosphaerae TaxID=274593 RepID=A0A7W5FP57_9BACL|nr:hypothetical protein [Paenibacillus phyllosphaerae]MBB3111704.1 putative protein kinase ArgK-like GTPase of G3E family [Paenibacillus phyllosphaerae]
MLLLLASFTLFAAAGCSNGAGNGDSGSGNSVSANVSQTSSEVQQDPWSGVTPATISDTKSGIESLQSAVKEFKQAVEAEQTEEIKKLAAEMAGVWVAMQADVKSANGSLHETIDGELQRLMAEVASDKRSKDVLIELDYSLYQHLRDLKQHF